MSDCDSEAKQPSSLPQQRHDPQQAQLKIEQTQQPQDRIEQAQDEIEQTEQAQDEIEQAEQAQDEIKLEQAQDEIELEQAEQTEQPLSKRAQKRLQRRELVKEFRRAKRQQLKASGQRPASGKRRRLTKAASRLMQDSPCQIRVVIDCSFDALMQAGEVCKLFNQLQHCYGYNRRSQAPMQLYVTDLGDKLLDKLASIGSGDYLNWDINWHPESYLSLFPREQIVYLCSESKTVLETLSPDCVYVIGGLVDHNHYPSHCYHLAQQLGLRTAQLPIAQHMRLNSRRVLTVDQVFNLLLVFSGCGSWPQALREVVPRRKIATDEAEAADQDAGASATADGAEADEAKASASAEADETEDIASAEADETEDNASAEADETEVNAGVDCGS